MHHAFAELVIGDVLIAPFVAYFGTGVLLLMFLRPLLRVFGFEHAFSNPPVALLCLFMVILASLIVLF